jgi:hypothetical protein
MPELPDEPETVIKKAEHYRLLLDELPEYWPITREGPAFWSLSEAEKQLKTSPAKLRQRYAEGLLPGARDEGGSSGLQIPRTALLIHLGRTATGWYKAYDARKREEAG